MNERRLWKPEIGQSVRVRLLEECPYMGQFCNPDPAINGKHGHVVRIDLSNMLPGHPFIVHFEEPVIGSHNYMISGWTFAAEELEALEKPSSDE